MSLKSISVDSKVRAYSPKGQWLPGKSRVLHNAPLLVYHPELATEIGFIQWTEESLYEPTAADEAAKLTKTQIGERRLATPVEPKTKQGKRDERFPVLYGDVAWGSGIKDLKTTGVSESVRSMARQLVKFQEDDYRWDRSQLANASAGVRGELAISQVADGTVITLLNGQQEVIKDGRGLIAADVYDLAMTQAAFDMVTFQHSWSSGGPHFVQRLDLNETLWAELLPFLSAGVEMLNSGSHFLFTTACDAEAKRIFVEADESQAMLHHPWVQRTVQQSKARAAYRLVTNGDLRMLGGVAVPCVGEELVLPSVRTMGGLDLSQEDEVIALRWPIDGWGSVRIPAVCHDPAKIEWANSMVNVQYTLTNHLADSFKGIATVIDRALLPAEYQGYDMVVSTEDRKLSSEWVKPEDVAASKVARTYAFEDAILVFIQVWGPGTAFGVPLSLQKAVNGDFDGDAMAVMPASLYPEITRQVRAWPQGANPKLPKVKTAILAEDESGARVALLSMMNGVGYATNIMAWTFASPNRETLAGVLGCTEDVLEQRIGRSIKLFTDIFKTSEDPAPTMQYLQTVAQGLKEAGYQRPAYLTWGKDKVGFYERLPKVGDISVEGLEWDDWDKRNHIPDTEDGLGGTVAKIVRWVLPQIQAITELEPSAPLGHFRNWAVVPATLEEYTFARRVIALYSELVSAVNFSDEDSWTEFLATWQSGFEGMLGSFEYNPAGISRERAVHSIWAEAHSDQRMSDLGPKGARVGASVAFVTDPAMAMEIIRSKPGLVPTEQAEVIILGLKKQLPQARPGLQMAVRVQEIAWKNASRQVLVAIVPRDGQVQPDSHLIPENTIAFVELRQQKLDDGKYWMTTAFDGKTWTAQLVQAPVTLPNDVRVEGMPL